MVIDTQLNLETQEVQLGVTELYRHGVPLLQGLPAAASSSAGGLNSSR